MTLLPAPPRRSPSTTLPDGSSPDQVMDLMDSVRSDDQLEVGDQGLGFYHDYPTTCNHCGEVARFRLGDAPVGTRPSWTDHSISNAFGVEVFYCGEHLAAGIERIMHSREMYSEVWHHGSHPDRYNEWSMNHTPIVVEVVVWIDPNAPREVEACVPREG